MSTICESIILSQWKPLSHYIENVESGLVYTFQNNGDGTVIFYDGETEPSSNIGIRLNPGDNLEYQKGIGTLYVKSLFKKHLATLTITNNE